MPSIEQAEIVVKLEAADDGFARRLGAFVVAAVERLQEGLGLPGGYTWGFWMGAGDCIAGHTECMQVACCQIGFKPTPSMLLRLCPYGCRGLHMPSTLGQFLVSSLHTFTSQPNRLSLHADLPGLPQQVVAMLRAGGWSATVIRWTRSIAERLQAAVLDGLLAGNSPLMYDATSALGLVRAATAALALVSDVGFEAAVRHLSGEYFTAASKVSGSGGLHIMDAPGWAA